MTPRLAIALTIHPLCMSEARRIGLDETQAVCLWRTVVEDMAPTMLADNTMNVCTWAGSIVNIADGSEQTENLVGRVAIGWIRARWTLPGAARERLPRPDVVTH